MPATLFTAAAEVGQQQLLRYLSDATQDDRGRDMSSMVVSRMAYLQTKNHRSPTKNSFESLVKIFVLYLRVI